MKIAEDNTPEPAEEGTEIPKTEPGTDEPKAPGMEPKRVRGYTILFADFEDGLKDIGTSNPDHITPFEILGAFDYISTMIRAGLTKEPPPVSVYQQLAISLGLTQVNNNNNNWVDRDGNYYIQTKLGFKPSSLIKK